MRITPLVRHLDFNTHLDFSLCGVLLQMGLTLCVPSCLCVSEFALVHLSKHTCLSVYSVTVCSVILSSLSPPPGSPGVFSECHKCDNERAQKLLVRVSPSWGRTTCLRLALEADNKSFVAQPGVQVLLQRHADLPGGWVQLSGGAIAE